MIIDVNVFPSPDKAKIQNEFFTLAELLRAAIVSAESYPIVVPVETPLWLGDDLYDILVSVLAKSGWDLNRMDYISHRFLHDHCTFKENQMPEVISNLPPYDYSYTLTPSREVVINLIKENMNVR